MALGLSCQFDASRFFAWLSWGLVVNDSLMVRGLPSESAVSYLSTAYFFNVRDLLGIFETRTVC